MSQAILAASQAILADVVAQLSVQGTPLIHLKWLLVRPSWLDLVSLMCCRWDSVEVEHQSGSGSEEGEYCLCEMCLLRSS
jgi:hypothetical protein